MNKIPCGCRTVENEDGNISAVVDRSDCQMDATTDAYLQMVGLKQQYEIEAERWKSIANQQSLRATELAKDCDTLLAQIWKIRGHFWEMSTRFHDANEHAVDFDECQVPRCKKNREMLGGQHAR